MFIDHLVDYSIVIFWFNNFRSILLLCSSYSSLPKVLDLGGGWAEFKPRPRVWSWPSPPWWWNTADHTNKHFMFVNWIFFIHLGWLNDFYIHGKMEEKTFQADNVFFSSCFWQVWSFNPWQGNRFPFHTSLSLPRLTNITPTNSPSIWFLYIFVEESAPLRVFSDPSM